MAKIEHKSKYDGVIQEFIEAKIENPRLPIKDFCKRKNVNYEPFFRVLKKDPKHMESILNGIRKRYHERSIEVDEALYQKALRGDPRAMRLWYEKMEDWAPPHEDKGENEFTLIISPNLIPGDQFPNGMVIEMKRASKEIPMLDLSEEMKE